MFTKPLFKHSEDIEDGYFIISVDNYGTLVRNKEVEQYITSKKVLELNEYKKDVKPLYLFRIKRKYKEARLCA